MNRPSEQSFIIDEHAAAHYWQGAGLFSIKTFSAGQVLYDIGKGKFRVDETNYLLLNHGQEYAIETEGRTNSFCLFFDPILVSSTYQTLTSKNEALLESLDNDAVTVPRFFQRTYPQNVQLVVTLQHIQMNYAQYDKIWLDEQLIGVLLRLFQLHYELSDEMNQIDAARFSTRQELYERLHLVRDYMHAMYSQPLDLSELASVVFMSPTHLLRTFKELFAQTPHQYLIEVRLHHARRLLTTTQIPITEISASVGFESLGSFSWLFRKRFGVSPRAYRNQY